MSAAIINRLEKIETLLTIGSAVWVTQNQVSLFNGWSRTEIETFRANNPTLCKKKGGWVYNKKAIDN